MSELPYGGSPYPDGGLQPSDVPTPEDVQKRLERREQSLRDRPRDPANIRRVLIEYADERVQVVEGSDAVRFARQINAQVIFMQMTGRFTPRPIEWQEMSLSEAATLLQAPYQEPNKKEANQ